MCSACVCGVCVCVCTELQNELSCQCEQSNDTGAGCVDTGEHRVLTRFALV